MKLGIVDLETGNIGSLVSAIKKLNINFKICKNNYDFEGIDKIILPGVGAFGDFMHKLRNQKIDKTILDKISKNCPILGVCVGFQILFKSSSEHKLSDGLGLLDGNLINFKEESEIIKVPHVGWNECRILKKNKLFEGIKNNSDFYFTHSYFLKNYKEENILSKTNYNLEFVSSINHKNIYGVQFHPEKSQINGLNILKNFYERC